MVKINKYRMLSNNIEISYSNTGHFIENTNFNTDCSQINIYIGQLVNDIYSTTQNLFDNKEYIFYDDTIPKYICPDIISIINTEAGRLNDTFNNNIAIVNDTIDYASDVIIDNLKNNKKHCNKHYEKHEHNKHNEHHEHNKKHKINPAEQLAHNTETPSAIDLDTSDIKYSYLEQHNIFTVEFNDNVTQMITDIKKIIPAIQPDISGTNIVITDGQLSSLYNNFR